MLAFTVNDTKSFMNLLLKGDTFDAVFVPSGGTDHLRFFYH